MCGVDQLGRVPRPTLDFVSSARRAVDQATRDDQADSAAAQSSSVQVSTDPPASAADFGAEQSGSAGAHDDDASGSNHTVTAASASVPGDPLAPQPSHADGDGDGDDDRSEPAEPAPSTFESAGADLDDESASESPAEPRSLVASARAKLEAARRSIAERARPDDDLPTEPVSTADRSYPRTADESGVGVERAFNTPPATPREPTPAGQPLPRDDSPAIAALRRFDEVSFAPPESDGPPKTTWAKRRATVVNAEQHLVAPVQRAIGRRPRVRKVTRVVRHVDPWTVFKVAAVFSTVVYGVLLTAGVLLWNVAHTTGTIDNIEQFFETFGWTEFELKGGQIYHSAWIAGLFGALALTGLSVLGATLFNLITDLVGGIRFTVLEEEVVEKTVSPMRRFTVRRTQGTAPSDE